jgi:hypothetical protein
MHACLYAHWLRIISTSPCSSDHGLVGAGWLMMCLQEDLHISLDDFRQKFGDVPQKGDLTLLCPLMDDPTEKVGSCSSSSSSSHRRHSSSSVVSFLQAVGKLVVPQMLQHVDAQLCNISCAGVAGETWMPAAAAGEHGHVAGLQTVLKQWQHLMPTCVSAHAVQIFVFFPDAAKVGVKDIKVSMSSSCHMPLCSPPASLPACQSAHEIGAL